MHGLANPKVDSCWGDHNAPTYRQTPSKKDIENKSVYQNYEVFI